MMYAVNDLYPTIQGEGVLTGVPMLLLRLHGCPVGCPFCDTKETWDARASDKVDTLFQALGATTAWCEVSEDDIADALRIRRGGERWVLLTGGEPAEQALAPLVARLHAEGWLVALETSGTATGHVGARCDWVTVSPKIGMPGKRVVHHEAVRAAHEIKFVVGRAEDEQRLLNFLDTYDVRNVGEMATASENDRYNSLVEVCVQPLSQSPKATQLCYEMAARHGWRVSIQTHKYVGLR